MVHPGCQAAHYNVRIRPFADWPRILECAPSPRGAIPFVLLRLRIKTQAPPLPGREGFGQEALTRKGRNPILRGLTKFGNRGHLYTSETSDGAQF